MGRNYQNLSCAAEYHYDTNKYRTCFKLFGAVINVCNNPQIKEEQQVVMENNCSSSISEITTLESYPSIDSAKSDGNVVILSNDEELVQSGARNSIWKRKRGESWSEEEHRLFLAGLEKLGSGRWKRIAEEFIPTRTPTLVASHAQKYFMRKASGSNGGSIRRRGSIFDNTPTRSVSTNAVEESSAQAANRVAPSPEVGPIVHVPCTVVRAAGGKVRLVPLFKRMPNYATVNNQGII